VKTLWIRDEYLAQILAGQKTIEVRVGYSNINRLKVGDSLLLNEQQQYIIRRVGRYADFEALLAREDAALIAPGIPAGELLERMRTIYPPEKEALGAIALEIAPA
jgi:ASC-1-like (ASCH) protein